jgi:hypothetical protein
MKSNTSFYWVDVSQIDLHHNKNYRPVWSIIKVKEKVFLQKKNKYLAIKLTDCALVS